MAKITNTGNTNILPHNPLKAAHPGFKPMEIFDHVKGLKGEEKGWFEFDLETLLKRFPDDKMLKQAYGDTGKGKKVEPPAPPARHGTSTKGRKTAAQMATERGRGAGSPATEQSPEQTAEELAAIA